MHYNAEDLQSILLQKRYKLFAQIKIIYYFCAENPWQYKKRRRKCEYQDSNT